MTIEVLVVSVPAVAAGPAIAHGITVMVVSPPGAMAVELRTESERLHRSWGVA